MRDGPVRLHREVSPRGLHEEGRRPHPPKLEQQGLVEGRNIFFCVIHLNYTSSILKIVYIFYYNTVRTYNIHICRLSSQDPLTFFQTF